MLLDRDFTLVLWAKKEEMANTFLHKRILSISPFHHHRHKFLCEKIGVDELQQKKAGKVRTGRKDRRMHVKHI